MCIYSVAAPLVITTQHYIRFIFLVKHSMLTPEQTSQKRDKSKRFFLSLSWEPKPFVCVSLGLDEFLCISCHNGVLMLALGLCTKKHLVGFEKHHGLAEMTFFGHRDHGWPKKINIPSTS